MGQRLVLWQAAVRAGQREPLAGVGFGRFDEELDRQIASGDVPASEKLLYVRPQRVPGAFAQAGSRASCRCR